MNENMTQARVDYMKWADMQFIHAVVEDIRTLSKKHTSEEMERHVRAVVTEIDDRFGGSLSSDAYHKVVLALRTYALFVRGNDDETNVNQSYYTTQLIINIVQGDNKMDKNQLTAMVYRRVIEAMNKAEHGAVNGYEPGPLASDIAEDTSVRIVEDVFGGKVPNQTSEYVDEYYEMDPETEDLLDNGTLIMDGMVVLAENPTSRTSVPTEDSGPAKVTDARMRNRWAKVENSKVYNDQNGTMLSFVAVYEDGVKRKRTCTVGHAWLVKKDSVPRIDTLMTDEGGVLESMTTAKMVAFFKDRMKFMGEHFNPIGYKIQTGIDGDVIPLDEYLIAEGVMAGSTEKTASTREFGDYSLVLGGPTSKEFASLVYEVFEKDDGNCVLVGASDDVLAWAEGVYKQTGDYDGFTVRRGDGFEDVELAEFVRNHNG